MVQTEWTEEKLESKIARLYRDATTITRGERFEALTSTEFANDVMSVVKQATYLKGNRELPSLKGYNPASHKQYRLIQRDMLKPPYNFKSTEEWKK